MGCDPGYSMETLYELCESRLYERISEEISREWRDEEERNIYNVGWNEKGKLLGEEIELSF
jgi:hypothetical protein